MNLISHNEPSCLAVPPSPCSSNKGFHLNSKSETAGFRFRFLNISQSKENLADIYKV